MNIEHRTSNIERRMNVFSLFKKDLAKRFHPSTFDIRYSIFCGSLFYFREVLYKDMLLRLLFLTPETNFAEKIGLKS